MICITNCHHAIVVPCPGNHFITFLSSVATNKQNEKVQVGKDQEKAQSERDSHSKNRGGKKPN